MMNINCCHIALAYVVITLPILAFLSSRTFILKAKVTKLEKKNGSEQKQLNELKLEVAELKANQKENHAK